MAIGWVTVLQNIPWSEVIRNAPRVTAAAKKLWKSVSGKTSQKNNGNDPGARSSITLDTGSGTEARIAALEKEITDLNSQMLASSELIKELADQNVQLIKRVEACRLRIFRLALASAAALCAGLAGLFFAIFRIPS